MTNRAEARISLAAIRENAENMISRIHGNCRMMAVVKANAYGHGALQVAAALSDMGVNDFAVATADEGAALRQSGIKGNILVLGKTDPYERDKLAEYTLQQACDSVAYAKSIVKDGKPEIQLMVDTGMGRLGFYCHNETQAEDCAEEMAQIFHIPSVKVRGIFTHFADAENEVFTREQFKAFYAVTDKLRQKGLDVGTRHCCNSAAALRYPEMQLDMVRNGIGLYGLERSEKSYVPKPAMTVCARIAAIGTSLQNDTVGYGRTYRAEHKIKRAVVSFGYADGMPRLLSNRWNVTVNGKKAPIIGTVCMDMFMIDVTVIKCSEGDEVIIFGEGGEVNAMADTIGTINYEIVCGISDRVKRIFTD